MKITTRQSEVLGFQSQSSTVAVRMKERQWSVQTIALDIQLLSQLALHNWMGKKKQKKSHSSNEVLLKESEAQTGWTQLAIRWVSALCNQVFHSFPFSHTVLTFEACQWRFVWVAKSHSKAIGFASASNYAKSGLFICKCCLKLATVVTTVH